MSSRDSGLCPCRKGKTRVLRRTATGRHRYLHILQQTAYILSPLWTSTSTITMIVWHAARCMQWADGVVDYGFVSASLTCGEVASLSKETGSLERDSML